MSPRFEQRIGCRAKRRAGGEHVIHEQHAPSACVLARRESRAKVLHALATSQRSLVARVRTMQKRHALSFKLAGNLLCKPLAMVEAPIPVSRFRGGHERYGIELPLWRHRAHHEIRKNRRQPLLTLVFVHANQFARFLIEFGRTRAASERQTVAPDAIKRYGVAEVALHPRVSRPAPRTRAPPIEERQCAGAGVAEHFPRIIANRAPCRPQRLGKHFAREPSSTQRFVRHVSHVSMLGHKACRLFPPKACKIPSQCNENPAGCPVGFSCQSHFFHRSARRFAKLAYPGKH